MLRSTLLPPASTGAFSLLVALAGCGDSSQSASRIPSAPPGPRGSVQPIIHTVDGRHLAFRPGDFQPSEIEHCREDGRIHLTSIFELTRLRPRGRTGSLCAELAGRYLGLYLDFAEQPAIKATAMCEDGCVAPGGYYPPVGTVIRIPWSEISFIEFRREPG